MGVKDLSKRIKRKLLPPPVLVYENDIVTILHMRTKYEANLNRTIIVLRVDNKAAEDIEATLEAVQIDDSTVKQYERSAIFAGTWGTLTAHINGFARVRELTADIRLRWGDGLARETIKIRNVPIK